MRCALGAAGCLLVAAAAAAWVPAVEDLVPEALEGDDACLRGGSEAEACALSALQRRGVAVAQAAQRLGRQAAAGAAGAGAPAAGRASAAVAAGGDGDPECDNFSGGSCKLLRCDVSRGPTQCEHRRCLCQDGFCAVNGVCKMAVTKKCGRHTGGTCSYVRCDASRGPTDCQDGYCVCKAGLCASAGRCTLPHGAFSAAVVPIDASRPVFPGAQGSVVTALCFSGGGSRSLSLTMGALRALEGLGLMPAVDAISSVSGGSWAAAIYMFADKAVEDLLGGPTNPADLTLEVLQRTPAAMGAAATADADTVALELEAEGMPAHRLWQRTVGALFLKPFGLDSATAFMAADAEAVARIVAANPQLQGMEFLTPRPGRPRTFVINGALLAPAGYLASKSNVVSFQVSPDFTGSPYYPDTGTLSYEADQIGGGGEALKDVLVGGGLVETFAFGGPVPLTGSSGGNDATMVAPALPFTLVDAVGISSAAFASQMMKRSLVPSGLVPKADVWPVLSEGRGEPVPAQTYTLGDGGNVENAGLLAMLQRRARKIVWWINTDTGISREVDFCGAMLPGATVLGLMSNQLYDKFGYGGFAREFLANNQVFKEAELPDLVCDLRKLIDAGKPAVVRRTMEVQENAWWGITAYTVDLVFVYNEHCKDFESALPADTQASLAEGGSGEFAHYPLLKTMFNNGLMQATTLSPPQINLLAAQSEYFVRQNEAMFRDVLSK